MRGGRRAGAGRPRAPEDARRDEQLSTRVGIAIATRVREAAAAAAMTPSAWLRQLVEREFASDPDLGPEARARGAA